MNDLPRKSSVPDYPTHAHQFVVIFYEDNSVDYMFGPFLTKAEADTWARAFNKRHARNGELYRYSRSTIFPVCEALPLTPL
jgi:hypothetical protein